MTISSDTASALTTLQAVYRIKHELGLRVSLGVSNISVAAAQPRNYQRRIFCTRAAKRAGLRHYESLFHRDDEILPRVSGAVRSRSKLCRLYPLRHNTYPSAGRSRACSRTHRQIQRPGCAKTGCLNCLRQAHCTACRKNAGQLAEAMLQSLLPLELINGHIIPALDTVGKGFEQGTVFLPQLLMSAEAAKQAL